MVANDEIIMLRAAAESATRHDDNRELTEVTYPIRPQSRSLQDFDSTLRLFTLNDTTQTRPDNDMTGKYCYRYFK